MDSLTQSKSIAMNLEVKYGLPAQVFFCKRCVISNQRPNSVAEFMHTSNCKKPTIEFDEDFVCDACRMAENKMHNIDWGMREKELIELCDKYNIERKNPTVNVEMDTKVI